MWCLNGSNEEYIMTFLSLDGARMWTPVEEDEEQTVLRIEQRVVTESAWTSVSDRQH